MAKFLISTSALGSEADDAVREPGDFISIYPDDQPRFGRAEVMSEWLASGEQARNFPHPGRAVLSVPGYPCDLNLVEWEQEEDRAVGEIASGRIKYHSAWGLDPTLVPANIWTKLEKPGAEVEVTISEFRQWTRRKSDSAVVPVTIGVDGVTKQRLNETRPKRGSLVLGREG